MVSMAARATSGGRFSYRFRGVCRDADVPESVHLDLLAVSLLALHELIDDVPAAVTLAVPRGTHSPTVLLPARGWLDDGAATAGRLRLTSEGLAHSDAVGPAFFSVRANVGQPCRTGESVVPVDGEGTVRRCHFVKDPIGNLYDGGYRAALRPRPCPLALCDCHIGYGHLESLPLYDVFAGGVLERILQAAWTRKP
jgi:hypothetical protein